MTNNNFIRQLKGVQPFIDPQIYSSKSIYTKNLNLVGTNILPKPESIHKNINEFSKPNDGVKVKAIRFYDDFCTKLQNHLETVMVSPLSF